ncbi:hypothetical protein KHQ82_08755 [Mycoplasmatota bacterium]|nr:hypothetical protein KHQ82_08755 [Mycoplasmatota bacterium]
MEEILAKVSASTFVFLDTLSTAAEYGMFTNAQANNFTYTLLPYEEDIINDAVGYYVKKSIRENRDIREIVDLVRYHPKVNRYAKSSDVVDEFFGFIKDELPISIEESVKKSLLRNKEKYEIDFSITNESSSDFFIKLTSDVLEPQRYNILCSTKLLFYIIEGFLKDEYGNKSEILINQFKYNLDDYVSSVIGNVNSLVINSLVTHNTITPLEAVNSKFDIDVDLSESIFDVVKHMIEFLILFRNGGNKYSKRRSLISNPNEIFTRFKSKISKNDSSFTNMITNDKQLINFTKIALQKPSYEYNKLAYSSFIVSSPKKKRRIVTYSKTEYGQNARVLHKNIVAFLNNHVLSDSNSYAYKTGRSTYDCVLPHLNSQYFFKADISSFFNSINSDILVSKIVNHIEDFNVQQSTIRDILHTQIENMVNNCYYLNKLPIGFVSSPKLSDIYLFEFDKEIGEYCKNRNRIYSRYADDIMISSENEIDIESIKKSVIDSLSKVKLTINSKKLENKKLLSIGDNVKFLGLNIVKKELGNTISVGKSYVSEATIEFCDIVLNKDINQRVKKVIGKLKYIIYQDPTKSKQIERIIKSKLLSSYNFTSSNDFMTLYKQLSE